MPTPSPRPSAQQTRLLLQLVLETRQQYSDYLRAVAGGERTADAATKELLQDRCETAEAAWQAANRAWQPRATSALATSG